MHRMRHMRRLHGPAAWLAALAMLLWTLAPAATRVLVAADSASWVPLCTADGVVQVQALPSGERIPNPAEHIAQADLPCCSLQGHASVLTSAEWQPALLAPAAVLAAWPGAALPTTARTWPAALARAPPPA
jgi:hypothetical protein